MLHCLLKLLKRSHTRTVQLETWQTASCLGQRDPRVSRTVQLGACTMQSAEQQASQCHWWCAAPCRQVRLPPPS